MTEEVKATETKEATLATEPVVQAKKQSSIPGIVLGFVGIFFVGFASIVTMFAANFYAGHREMNMPPETVAKLADMIVDPNVTATKLEERGFYKANMGGVFLDGCRKEVLTDEFNKNLAPETNAAKIDSCIKRELITLGARATMVRRYN